MATTFIRSTSPVGNGRVQKTTEIDGVRTVVIQNETDETRKADIVSATAYNEHVIQNPQTGEQITVETTGNEAQDAAVLARAFAEAGTLTPTIISKT